jgi:hypothetical protein
MNVRNSALTILAAFGTALLILIASPWALANSDTSETPQSAQQAPGVSRLQVTGSQKQFSIEADHADIQSALKAVFVQAGKQFDLDNNVAGQLTLKLDNQALDTVLSSLCRQTFLKYHQDNVTGVYRFEQDTEAVKAAFARIDTLNNQLRQQLRNIGLDLPGDAQLDGALNRSNLGAAIQLQDRIAGDANSPKPGSGGGFGGGEARVPGGINAPPQTPGTLNKAGAPGSQGGQNSGQTNGQSNTASKSAGAAAAPNGAYTQRELDTGNVPDYLVEQLLQAYGMTSNRPSGAAVDKAVDNYLRQNNLVAINTHGVAVPVTDVLAELSRQSGTAIMLDPTVPRGARFRITLSLPACSLTEALNLILPPARLKWRTINNAIFVTPTPEFQIFYGSAPVPYVIYGSNSNSRNLQQGGAQNGVQAPGPTGNPK